jgi:hypothetical protein
MATATEEDAATAGVVRLGNPLTCQSLDAKHTEELVDDDEEHLAIDFELHLLEHTLEGFGEARQQQFRKDVAQNLVCDSVSLVHFKDGSLLVRAHAVGFAHSSHRNRATDKIHQGVALDQKVWGSHRLVSPPKPFAKKYRASPWLKHLKSVADNDASAPVANVPLALADEEQKAEDACRQQERPELERRQHHFEDPNSNSRKKCNQNTTQSSQPWTMEDPSKWHYAISSFDGTYMCASEPQLEVVAGAITNGMSVAKANPAKYEGFFFDSRPTELSQEHQSYTMVRRTGSGFAVTHAPSGPYTWVSMVYQALSPDVCISPDAYTDQMHFNGKAVVNTILPGRGMGCADIPGLTLVGHVSPSDIVHGTIGDRWLLSALAALAEFEGAIRTLFEHTVDIHNMPRDSTNQYTVSLYDLPTWQRVDVLVDERLCCGAGGGLLGCSPGIRGALWPCYVEKAIVAHCGGWDKIEGGNCAHALRLLTGCKEQYTFRDDGSGFACTGAFNPNANRWEGMANSPHDGFRGMWPMPWPEVGGGGEINLKLHDEAMFERMCAWKAQNYIMCCVSGPVKPLLNLRNGLDADGMVDVWAYTILECVENAGGVAIDMIKVRSPCGHGELQAGTWKKGSLAWKEYPSLEAACGPEKSNDGTFWVDAEEFFRFFRTIHLCAQNMTDFVNKSVSEATPQHGPPSKNDTHVQMSVATTLTPAEPSQQVVAEQREDKPMASDVDDVASVQTASDVDDVESVLSVGSPRAIQHDTAYKNGTFVQTAAATLAPDNPAKHVEMLVAALKPKDASQHTAVAEQREVERASSDVASVASVESLSSLVELNVAPPMHRGSRPRGSLIKPHKGSAVGSKYSSATLRERCQSRRMSPKLLPDQDEAKDPNRTCAQKDIVAATTIRKHPVMTTATEEDATPVGAVRLGTSFSCQSLKAKHTEEAVDDDEEECLAIDFELHLQEHTLESFGEARQQQFRKDVAQNLVCDHVSLVHFKDGSLLVRAHAVGFAHSSHRNTATDKINQGVALDREAWGSHRLVSPPKPFAKRHRASPWLKHLKSATGNDASAPEVVADSAAGVASSIGAQLPQGTPLRGYRTVVFKPGALGLKLAVETGRVDEVYKSHQAERLGVQEGWRMDSIEGMKYFEDLLRNFTLGTRDYTVNFQVTEAVANQTGSELEAERISDEFRANAAQPKSASIKGHSHSGGLKDTAPPMNTDGDEDAFYERESSIEREAVNEQKESKSEVARTKDESVYERESSTEREVMIDQKGSKSEAIRIKKESVYERESSVERDAMNDQEGSKSEAVRAKKKAGSKKARPMSSQKRQVEEGPRDAISSASRHQGENFFLELDSSIEREVASGPSSPQKSKAAPRKASEDVIPPFMAPTDSSRQHRAEPAPAGRWADGESPKRRQTERPHASQQKRQSSSRQRRHSAPHGRAADDVDTAPESAELESLPSDSSTWTGVELFRSLKKSSSHQALRRRSHGYIDEVDNAFTRSASERLDAHLKRMDAQSKERATPSSAEFARKPQAKSSPLKGSSKASSSAKRSTSSPSQSSTTPSDIPGPASQAPFTEVSPLEPPASSTSSQAVPSASSMAALRAATASPRKAPVPNGTLASATMPSRDPALRSAPTSAVSQPERPNGRKVGGAVDSTPRPFPQGARGASAMPIGGASRGLSRTVLGSTSRLGPSVTSAVTTEAKQIGADVAAVRTQRANGEPGFRNKVLGEFTGGRDARGKDRDGATPLRKREATSSAINAVTTRHPAPGARPALRGTTPDFQGSTHNANGAARAATNVVQRAAAKSSRSNSRTAGRVNMRLSGSEDELMCAAALEGSEVVRAPSMSMKKRVSWADQTSVTAH